MAYRIADLALEAMLYLHQHEFTTAERERKFGAMVVMTRSYVAFASVFT